MLKNAAIAERINLCVLLAGIIMLTVLYPTKQLNFDEPFSIMCSKGITSRSVGNLQNPDVITSAQISAQNTYHNVFQGGDSFYYVGLHYFSSFFRNTVTSYVAFSIIWSILSLIAFYYLCKTVLGPTLFTSLALALFVTDTQIMNTTFLIRPYTMSVFMVVVSGIYFFRYQLQQRSAVNLMLLGLFGVFAILTHYFTVYIVLAYVVILLCTDGIKLFTPKNIAAIMVPLAVLATYFLLHRSLNTSYNSYQGYAKDGLHLKMLVSAGEAAVLFAKSIAVNFRAIYPLFKASVAVTLLSFLLIIAVYIYGIKKVITPGEDRRKFHLLFALGISGSVFLGVLCYAMNNTLLFNYRYFVFSFPFCVLFVVLFVRALATNSDIMLPAKAAFMVLLLAPAAYKLVRKGFENTGFPSNHFTAAQTIVRGQVHKTEVPGLIDAIFINCLLPDGYELTYTINPKSNNFTLYTSTATQQIPAIHSDILLLY